LKSLAFLKILFIGLILIILFSPLYPSLFERFQARDSYYSHGFLIPFVSFYLIWRKRNKISSLVAKPNLLGLAVVLGGLVLYIISLFIRINFTGYLSIPIVIWGIILYLGGWQIAKELFFPIGFLIFMLPLPKVLIIAIAFKLKILVAQVSTFLINSIGIEAKRVGSTIYYPGGHLLVGDPCSGLRSLISFLALGALLTQFIHGSFLKKGLFFLLAFPIAFISNIIRIVLLLLVSYIYGEKVALGFFHDFSGMMVFILGFLGLLALTKLLKCHHLIRAT